MACSKELSQSIGAKIRMIRLAKGLSQEKLALECEMNPAFLGHVERGLRCPTIFTLQRICDGLQISLAELFLYDAQPQTNTAAVQHITQRLETLSPEQAAKIVKIVDNAIELLE